MTRDMHFSDFFKYFFHFADDVGVCVFWVCPTTQLPCHLRVININRLFCCVL